MTSPESDFDSLVAALRSDLPSTSDERRMRRRLLAAGIGVTTSMVAPGATATGLAGGSSLPAALLHKLGALSWAAKVGLAGFAVTAALPAAVYLTSAKPSSPAGAVAPFDAGVPARSVPRSPTPKALPAPEPVPLSPPGPSGAESPPPPGRTSSAAFPTGEPGDARARSTLGEETVLVERALYALRRGDHVEARKALEEHARRFPNGLLARERDRALSRTNAMDAGN